MTKAAAWKFEKAKNLYDAMRQMLGVITDSNPIIKCKKYALSNHENVEDIVKCSPEMMSQDCSPEIMEIMEIMETGQKKMFIAA